MDYYKKNSYYKMILKERDTSDKKLYIISTSPRVWTEEAPVLPVMRLHCRHSDPVLLSQNQSNKDHEESGKGDTIKGT